MANSILNPEGTSWGQHPIAQIISKSLAGNIDELNTLLGSDDSWTTLQKTNIILVSGTARAALTFISDPKVRELEEKRASLGTELQSWREQNMQNGLTYLLEAIHMRKEYDSSHRTYGFIDPNAEQRSKEVETLIEQICQSNGLNVNHLEYLRYADVRDQVIYWLETDSIPYTDQVIDLLIILKRGDSLRSDSLSILNSINDAVTKASEQKK